MVDTRIPDFDELAGIHSCIKQLVRENNFPTDFYIIQVWYADIARKTLKSDTKNGEYCVRFKSVFGNQHTKNHAQKIWNAGLMPIEIIQNSGCLFFSLPRHMVLTNTFENTFFLLAENDIPSIQDFEKVTQ